MLSQIAKLPLLVILIAVGGIAMFLPAAHASATGETDIAEVFFTFGALSLVLALFIAIAMAGQVRREHPRRHLGAFLALFVLAPMQFALPFHDAVGNTSFLNAYVEMVSSLTTTGATLYDEPGRLAMSFHLWRATVGWLGGLFVWVGAIAVLAPMALGGFEVRRRQAQDLTRAAAYRQITEVADLSYRVRVYGARLLPIYGGLTVALWIALIVAGEMPATALVHAMSTLSTSGISPGPGGVAGGSAGFAGEVVIAVFLIFAISRLTFARDGQGSDLRDLRRDPEIQIAGLLVAGVPLILFIRQYIGAYEVEGAALPAAEALASLWGSVFTVLSFLTTTGFVSASWDATSDWSGLQTPGLLLMGLALIGGGVATTAGGTKLLRVYALYKHGVRELERLVHPHSVGGSGGEARHLRRRGAYMAWLFFMLMAMSVALVMAAFSLTGENFEEATVLTIAALTTTGPLAEVAGSEPIRYALMTTPAKLVLTVAMVVGRLETLAIVALFSPDLWRR